MSFVKSIIAFLTAVVCASGYLHADLIVNGGFEDPVLLSGTSQSYSPGSTMGSGWITLGDVGTTVGILRTELSETINGMTAFNSQSGFNSFDSTGPYNQGPTLGIQQVVTTTVGENYTLSFWVGTATPTFGTGSASFYHDPGTIDLRIDNGARVSFTNSLRTNGFVNWQQFSYQFAAANSSTTIAFLNGTLPVNGIVNFQGTGLSGSNYVGLDDVTLTVTSVPEPGIAILGGSVLLATLVRTRLMRRRLS